MRGNIFIIILHKTEIVINIPHRTRRKIQFFINVNNNFV